MNQTELEKLINKYTENYSKIPECIYTNYLDALDMADLCSFVSTPEIGIWTPFGVIKLKLDPDTTNPYGAEE